MSNRVAKIAKELVRQATLKLPHPVFLGWRDFLYKLNSFINEYIRRKEDELEFVTLEDNERNSAVLNVYIGESERFGFDPEKLIKGIQYFLGEMGIGVDSIKKNPGEPDNIFMRVSGISYYEGQPHHRKIKNQWMKNALSIGDAIDVRMIGVEVEPGVFKLNEFIPGIKYVDAEDESFIVSVGKDMESGEIFASVDDRFYNNEEYECIYLI